MKMLIARFHTLIASWLLATVLPSNFMLGGNFFATKKRPTRKNRARRLCLYTKKPFWRVGTERKLQQICYTVYITALF